MSFSGSAETMIGRANKDGGGKKNKGTSWPEQGFHQGEGHENEKYNNRGDTRCWTGVMLILMSSPQVRIGEACSNASGYQASPHESQQRSDVEIIICECL